MKVLFPSSEPAMRGAFGRAWIIDRDAIAAKHEIDKAKSELTLTSYVAHAAYAHPVWHSYLIACISLRELAGAPKPVIHMPGATHEVLVYALDPEQPIDLTDFPRILTPANFHGQFIEPDDAAAEARIKQTVQDVIDGVLNPDTDFMRHWIHRFSASNIKGDPKTAGETRIVMDRGDGSAPVEVVIPPQPGPQDLN